MNEIQERIQQDNALTQVPLEQLPTPNYATIDMLESNDNVLSKLREDQHYCDSMVLYWQTRHANVSRAIEAVVAANAALNHVPSRDTRVVTKGKLTTPPARKRAPKPDQSNA